MEKINKKVEKIVVISGENNHESGEKSCCKWRKKHIKWRKLLIKVEKISGKVEKIYVENGENGIRKMEKKLAYNGERTYEQKLRSA